MASSASQKIKRARELRFPGLCGGGYRKTSDESVFYNCVAWVFGETNTLQWWDPFESAGCYWPAGVVRGTDAESFVNLFRSEGNYEKCVDGSFEEGFEKIAIYEGVDKDFSHVAKQKHGGKWTSKLGEWEDIEHDTWQSLEGDYYGHVVVFMRRPAHIC